MTSSNKFPKTNTHFIPQYFKNPTHKISVNVIGCGGTGSLVLARLARMDNALHEMGHPGLNVMAIDGDIVEQTNIGRQNFTPSDLGKNKAMSLITKINMAFGLQWNASVEMFDKDLPKANITISCVDKVKVRRKLSELYRESDNSNYQASKQYYWLDTGNGSDFGQCVLSTKGELIQPEISKYKTVGRLKNVFEIFGDLEVMDTEDKQGMESCSMAESLLKQDLFINDFVANSAVNILWKLFRKSAIQQQGSIINLDTDQQMPLPIR